MVSEIDVRGTDTEAARERVRECLAGIDAGEAATVAADHDPEPALYQYQIEHGEVLAWSRDDGDEEERLRVRKTGEDVTDPVAFDVRTLPPKRRHEVLTETFARLDPDNGFVLVNDHDPKPLYHELSSTHGDVVGWEYEREGGDEWRVSIEKTGDAAGGDDEVAAAFDVREIPKPERHPTIHHRYANIGAGETMEIVAPHEPKPLKREFDQQYGEAFAWEIVDRRPGEVRVRITKESESDAEGSDSGGGAVPSGHGHGHGGSCGHGHGGHGHGHGSHGHGHGGGGGGGPSRGDTGDLERTEVLDVREYPPAKRHELIFEAYDDLEGGESFVLVNDHDPKPLYHQFEAEAGPEFCWEYEQREAGEFRVAVGRAEEPVQSGGGQPATGFDAPF